MAATGQYVYKCVTDLSERVRDILENVDVIYVLLLFFLNKKISITSQNDTTQIYLSHRKLVIQ